MKRTALALIGVSLFVGIGTLLVQQWTPGSNDMNSLLRANAFVGDRQCARCHARQYDDWLASDHFKAMQPASDSTVKGDFNDRTFTADGITSRLRRQGSRYLIHTQGEDGTYHDYEVKYTFGYKPLQQYLVAFPGGRLQVARQSWDTKNKQWFHQYAGQTIPSHDWLHWTGNAQNWNTTCAACHSTNLKKNYDWQKDAYQTTYSVMTVSCESCHGAGQSHIAYINGTAYEDGDKVRGSYLQLPTNTGQLGQINACAPCHSRRSEVSAELVATPELMDNYIPDIPSTESFHADGQARDEDYTYASFLQSKMYARGVKCSNCHDPHSGKLVLTGNRLCLQCHAKKYDDDAHTFHRAGTAASECKSCHMPGTVYMGNDLRHDHAFRAPRPDLSVKYGTPNACNKCHEHRSPSWTASAVSRWYGPARAYHFAEDLIPASRGDANSEGHVGRLLNDTTLPPIIRATALHYLSAVSSPASWQALLGSLRHRDAQVRYQALRSLAGLPAAVWLQAIGPLLSDKVRAVRIAAADLLIAVPAPQLPPSYQAAFALARNELEQYVLYQTDFASGNVMAGDYYLRLQDYDNAEKFYLRGLQKDTAMNYARLNLSAVYNARGKNKEALGVLQEALQTDATNDRIHFNLALLYNELDDPARTEKHLAKAVALKSRNPRVYYNFGLLLQQQGRTREAIAMLRRGLTLSPVDADISRALCVLYVQSSQIDKAEQPGCTGFDGR